MDNLMSTINYVVNRSVELKNKFTSASLASVEFACIFCQNENEYKELTDSIEKLGVIAEKTNTGNTYFLKKPVNTPAGDLRLVKIRKPDSNRPERGDADFNLGNYKEFKKKYLNNPKFELVKRDVFEMIRLSDPSFDVMACFSSIPKSNILGIKL